MQRQRIKAGTKAKLVKRLRKRKNEGSVTTKIIYHSSFVIADAREKHLGRKRIFENYFYCR